MSAVITICNSQSVGAGNSQKTSATAICANKQYLTAVPNKMPSVCSFKVSHSNVL